jgi:hypothetical protein
LEAALAQLILLSKRSEMDKHVVFVHGLRRANVKVWRSSGKRPEVWPRWLSADIEGLGIWSVEHDSAPTLWRGYSMPLVDRANNILALLLSEEPLKQGDISFVVHSFGGLIFEQLLPPRATGRRRNRTWPTSSSASAVSRFWALRIWAPI